MPIENCNIDNPKHAGGRPTLYSEKLALKICERIINGESLASICRNDAMPCASTVYKWLDEKPEFLDKYAKAKEDQADTLADEMLDIADDGRNDWMARHDSEGNSIGWQVNGEHVQRSRLRLDTRKWIASKLKPKKYGENNKVELTGKNGGAIETKEISLEDTARKIAFILSAATLVKKD